MSIRLVDSIPPGQTWPASKLGTAHFAGDPRALPFLGSGDGFVAAAAGRPTGHDAERDLLCDALADFNASLGATAATRESIERLRRGDALVVATGQQTAPLTGPYLTVLKAVTAIRLSRRLTSLLKRECVPVFWAEGDDHDVMEISRLGLGYTNEGLDELPFSWPGFPPETPMGDLPFPMVAGSLRAELAKRLPPTEFLEEALDLAFPAGPESGQLGPWFCAVMLALFSRFGLVVAYSRNHAFRALYGNFALRVLEESPALTEEISRAAAALEAAGFKPQLHKAAHSLPFFLMRHGKRLPLHRHDGGYRAGEHEITASELRSRLEEDPAAFSPGVVLRPLLQDSLLPTVAYVAGVSEASYHGQLGGMYRLLGIPRPVVTPRHSVTFLEPSVRRVLNRHSLSPSRLLTEQADAVFAGLVRTPGSLADPAAWEAILAASRSPLLEFAARLPGDHAPLRGYIEKVSGQVAHLVRDVEKRVSRELRARNEVTRDQIRRAADRLLPGGSLMERHLSIFFFLAKYGPSLIKHLVEGPLPEPGGHDVLAFEEDG